MIKRLVILVVTFIGILSLQSCDKFLDIKPENVKVVSTIEDYRDLLASYMWYLKTPNRSYMSVLGGYNKVPLFHSALHFAYRSGELVVSKKLSYYYDATLSEYTPEAVKRMTWMEQGNECWDRYYSFLGPINLIINGIETAEGDDERLRDYVKGEALVWRAYAYYKLLQYYAPYDKNEYGIPVYLKPYEDIGNAMPARETQTDVYRQIISDCEEVFRLLERTPTAIWNCAYQNDFVHSLLASVYWYKALSAAAEDTDWENALIHAEEAMKGRIFVRDSATFASLFDVAAAENSFLNDEFNIRLIDDGSNRQLANFVGTYYQNPNYEEANPSLDTDFYALFKDDDVRKLTYFRTNVDGVVDYDKYNIAKSPLSMFGISGGIIMLFRSADMQLIKAEALCRLGREGEAKEALDFFKQGRYFDVAGSYTESDLLNEILKERKLEFFHEQDYWWLDMKRLGTRVERVVNGTLYILEPDDFRYSFPIPQSEMEVNKNMVQNPGWDEVDF